MTRSTAVMLVVFLVVVLLYLWVRDEPFVRIGPAEPEPGGQSTSQTVEPTPTTGGEVSTPVEPTAPTSSVVFVPDPDGTGDSPRPEPTGTAGVDGGQSETGGGGPGTGGPGQAGPAGGLGGGAQVGGAAQDAPDQGGEPARPTG